MEREMHFLKFHIYKRLNYDGQKFPKIGNRPEIRVRAEVKMKINKGVFKEY